MLSFRVILLVLMSSVLFFSHPAAAMDDSTSKVQGSTGDLKWSIYGQTGYQHMDVRYNAVFPRGPFIVELADPSPLDIKIRNANLWMGGIGADVKKGPLSFFLDLKATLPRDITHTTSSEPFNGGLSSVRWEDSRLKWWKVSAGTGIDITPNIAAQVGFNWEHLSLTMNSPADPLFNAFHDFFGDTYNGSLKSNLLVPWLGFKVNDDRLGGSFRFSPVAYTDVKAPFTYTFVAVPHSSALVVIEQERYTLKRYGMWLEGNLDYDIYRAGQWKCSLWTSASWLRTHGSSSNSFNADMYTNGTLTSNILSNNNSGSSTYSVSTYAIGVRITY